MESLTLIDILSIRRARERYSSLIHPLHTRAELGTLVPVDTKIPGRGAAGEHPDSDRLLGVLTRASFVEAIIESEPCGL